MVPEFNFLQFVAAAVLAMGSLWIFLEAWLKAEDLIRERARKSKWNRHGRRK